MKLAEIARDGGCAGFGGPLPEIARSAVESTVEMYARVGWVAPWIGYLAIEEGACVGTCAFTGPPGEGRVEIAYFTFPGQEGRGVATRMAGRLLDLAREAAPGVVVTAHTLREEGASTRILRRLGFVLEGPAEHPRDGPIWIWRLARRDPGGAALASADHSD